MQPSRSPLAATAALLLGVTVLGGCSRISTSAGQEPSPTPSPSAAGLRTIAKDDGIPPAGITPASNTVLVVPDDLVDTVLSDVGVEELPRVDGEPLQTGRYADFSGADDLAPDEVLAIWYSGQSGSCPTYLQGLSVTAGGDVDIETFDTGPDECTADSNPYRQVVVLPEDAVPRIADLPLTADGGDNPTGDLVVDVYPAPPAP